MEFDAYSTLQHETPWRAATAQRLVSPAGLHNDELAQQLVELRSRLQETGDTAPALPAVLEHLRHTQWHYAVTTGPRDMVAQLATAREAHALIVLGDKVLNPAGEVLVGPGAQAGEVPVHPEALARSERVRRDLAAHDVTVPAGAIPVRSTEELMLRRPDEIARRAVALVVSADFALSVLDEAPLDWEYMARTFPRSFAERTPSEITLFSTRDPAVAGRLKWGYEAAAQLLAMCGRVEATFPRDFADQGQVWNASVGIEEPTLLQSLHLIAPADICDAWESARALHHTVTVARAAGNPPPAELDPEIVVQRYRAMEWLTGDQPWDDIALDVPCTT